MQELMRVFVWNLLNSVHLEWWLCFCRCALVCKTTTLIISSYSRVSCRTTGSKEKPCFFRKQEKCESVRKTEMEECKGKIKLLSCSTSLIPCVYFSVFALVALDFICVVAFLSIRCNLKTLHTLHIVRWKCACASCAHQLLCIPLSGCRCKYLNFTYT